MDTKALQLTHVYQFETDFHLRPPTNSLKQKK